MQIEYIFLTYGCIQNYFIYVLNVYPHLPRECTHVKTGYCLIGNKYVTLHIGQHMSFITFPYGLLSSCAIFG